MLIKGFCTGSAFLISLLLPVLICGCSVTEFSVKDEDIRNIRTVGIIYEDNGTERPESLVRECAVSFRKYIEESGLKVIDSEHRKKVTTQDDQKGVTASGNCSGFQSSGIDALLTYRIPEYRETKTIGFRKKRIDGMVISPFGGMRSGKLDDSDEETIEIKTFYFRINLSLISCSTGKTLIAAENTMTHATDELAVYESMNDFKRYILDQFGKDLKKTISGLK